MGVVSEGRGRGATVYFEIPLYKSELDHRPSPISQPKRYSLGISESTKRRTRISVIENISGARILGDEAGTLADLQLSDPPGSDNEHTLFSLSRKESISASQSTTLRSNSH